MILLAVVVVLIPYICPISLVTGVETTATPWESTTGRAAMRIVGGEITSIKKYPFIVSVQLRSRGLHSCGGTYVTDRFVLSAAHCMIRRCSAGGWIAVNPRQFYVLAGATYVYLPSWDSVQVELVDKTLPHAGFRFSDFQNDIGLFRLKKPFIRNEYVQYVKLPPAYITNLFQKYRDDCVALGWGYFGPRSRERSSSYYLRHVRLPLISPDKCPMPNVHKEKQLCAGVLEGGRDTCQGDSGGPLLCNGTQIGIISWGIGCARPNTSDVYTRVDFYLLWLKMTIRRNGSVKFFQNMITIIFASFCTCMPYL